MTHAVVKGKAKVESEYRLAAIAYNLLRTVQILGLEKLQEQLRSLFFRLCRLLWATWRLCRA
jgi:hypothetical protein